MLALILATPSYKAELHIRPPLTNQVADINSSSLIQITNEEALYRVADELRTLATQRTVFEVVKNDFPQEPPKDQDNWGIIFAEAFAQSISVNIGRVDERKGAFDIYANLAFKHWNPEFVAATTNALADQALEDTRLAIVSEVKGIATAKLNALNALNASLQQQLVLQQTISQDEISRLREADQLARLELLDRITIIKATAVMNVQDEITRLEEAYSIAKRLGIDDLRSLSLLSEQGSEPIDSVGVSTEVSESEKLIYMRGTRALGAEIEALKSRDSNDFATPELGGLEERFRLLDNNRRSEQLAARKDFGPYVAGIEAIRGEMTQLEGVLAQTYDDVALARTGVSANSRRLCHLF